MIIYSARSTGGEARVALTPQAVEKLTRLGAGVEVEAGYGELLALADQEFERAGARVRPDPDEALAGADVVVGLMEPT